MKHIAKYVVALVLGTGMAFPGWAPTPLGGDATIKGGAIGCCRLVQ